MQFEKTDIEGVWIITPKLFPDDRGYFMESFRQDLFEKHVGAVNFIQDNESKSEHGVLRGLHYQLPQFAQSKLVRAVQGKVLDVVVDIREGSPTFGKHVACVLSDENKKQLFAPRGFAHAFITLSPTAVFQYKVDNLYNKNSERRIKYDDPVLKIDWKLEEKRISQSAQDETAPLLRDADIFNLGWDR
ncbi:dTDP-4-dehydrorhamnose 3,5-epimerase [bacterium]|nr:dTDP-4-dehydrorhamnose 3,5-epimerase [bacterium]